jgi:hypothetical protein
MPWCDQKIPNLSIVLLFVIGISNAILGRRIDSLQELPVRVEQVETDVGDLRLDVSRIQRDLMAIEKRSKKTVHSIDELDKIMIGRLPTDEEAFD